ncbi:MAG: type II toxin-antitoxin system RelE/ParE family toxin [Tissierellia bacterium]|nr:type II toxin-antitoxin system RelE/ParE family toxin [Tissierellia bacterium]
MIEVHLTRNVQKYLKKIKDKELIEKIKESFQKISEDYTVGELKSGDLKGIYCLDFFYNKTNYEIAYIYLDDEIIVLVLMVGTRENFYKELKKHIKK